MRSKFLSKVLILLSTLTLVSCGNYISPFSSLSSDSKESNTSSEPSIEPVFDKSKIKGVNMNYELVTSSSGLVEGDLYTFMSFDDYGHVMANTTSINNRFQRTFTLDNDTPLGDDDVLYVEYDETSNGGTFLTTNYAGDDGYLNTTLTTSKNYLQVISVLDDYAYFDITFNTDETADIVFKGKSSRNHVRYNKSNSCFSCYNSNSDVAPIYLYRVVDHDPTYEIDLDYTALVNMSKKYYTGNNGKITVGDVDYEYYRTVRASNNSAGYTFRMLDVNYPYADGGYPSAFYNISPIYGITKISLNYKAADDVKIVYFKDVTNEQSATLDASIDYVDGSVNMSNANFFKILTDGGDVFINSIHIEYTGVVSSYIGSKTYSENRKDVSMYSGTITEGVTKEMYISPTETKTYVYHTTEYVKNNIGSFNLSDICYITPTDVCNYYMAFHAFPCNYYDKDEASLYNSTFGSYGRISQTFDRTNGYATAVPYNNKEGSSKPIYYELDIDVTGVYTTSNRQVGRVIAWEYGFSVYSTSSEHKSVCVYTDDHYSTFMEYNNMGGFSPRFNAERKVVFTPYCKLITI